MSQDSATPADRAPARRRRRAVGPPGATPSAAVPQEWRRDDGPGEQPVDDDARLLADVPPHHGSV